MPLGNVQPFAVLADSQHAGGLSVRSTCHAACTDAIRGVWDSVLKKQIKRNAEGLDAAKELIEEFSGAKRRPDRMMAERMRFVDVAERSLIAYKLKRDGTPGPKSSLAKERTC